MFKRARNQDFEYYGDSSDEFDPSFYETPKRKSKKKKTNLKKQKNFYNSSSFEDTDDSLDSSDFISATSEEENQNSEEEDFDDLIDEVPQLIIGKKENTENEDDQYYVKFANLSYIHCKYMTGLELQVSSAGKKAKSRFDQRLEKYDLVKSDCLPGLLSFEDKDPQPEFYKVDRILDEKETKGGKTKIFVKWQNLGYDECTWEKVEDVGDCTAELNLYHQRLDKTNRRKIPSRWVRPPPSHYHPEAEYPQSKEGLSLRAYQKVGVDWLRFCYYNRRNSILADEMGLGKTAQVVQCLSSLSRDEGINGPFLVVAPLSTLHQWRQEFERWSDLNAVVYHGNSAALETIRETEFVVVDKDGRRVESSVGFDVLVTNYDTLMAAKELADIDWHYMVVDEGHRLKNRNSALYQRLQQLTWNHCTLLTGTPIQNRMDELFSLLSFIDPQKFGDEEKFDEQFGQMKESAQVDELKALIKPYILRRVKAEVESSLLAKEEIIINVELTKQQKKYYKALISDNKEVLLKRLTKGSVPSLTSLCTELRKVCNHPYLIKGAEEQIVDDFRRENGGITDEHEIEVRCLVNASGKLILIDKLLPKLLKDGHKVLIFSQWTHILDILEDYMRYKSYKYERLDGSVKGADREISIKRYTSEPDSFVFLISTKAGGVGINLTTADTVILFDSDWNPQNDLQAEARCHRIGQKRRVKVYRLVTRETYESKMIEIASRKLGLEHVVLDGRNSNLEKLNAKEIEEMLRTGVSSIFSDDNTECDKFCAQDIDQILERGVKVTQSDVVSGGDSIYGKATFIANSDEDISMSAADFWTKVLPDAAKMPNSYSTEDDTFYVEGTVRRCRKDVLSPQLRGKEEELNIAVNTIIDCGFRDLHMESEVLRRAASSFKFEDENDRSVIEKLVGEIPEECIFGDTPADARITRKSELIIGSALFFHRLRLVLTLAQDTENEWPVIVPAWEGIFEEYSLILALSRSGWSQLQNETQKNEYRLRNIELPSRKEIEILVSSLSSAMTEKNSALLDKKPLQSFQEPDEWFSSHITEALMQKHIRLNIFNALSLFGTHTVKQTDEIDWPRFIKQSGIHSSYDINELTSIAENVLNDINSESEKLCKQVSEKKVREAKENIRALSAIHKIAEKLANKKGYFSGTPKGLPEWWTPVHSKYFIQNMSKYGMSRISTWISDKSGPFFAVIPSSCQKSFQNAAKREEENRKAEKPSKTGSLAFLFEKNRASIGLRICETFVEAEISEIRYDSVPQTPFKVDNLTVTSFGTIYKGDRYRGRLTPYPIGYTSERKFRISGSKRSAQVIRSEICDGPTFVVTLIGQKEKVLSKGISPTDAWQKAIDKLARSERLDPSKTKFSGSSLFGLTQPQVFKIIKNMDFEAKQMDQNELNNTE